MSDLHRRKIYVAGHRGLAGSALLRRFREHGCENLVTRTHGELDLCDGSATRQFFQAERPEIVVLAAAKVGGILANIDYPAEFVRENLAIQTNVIHEAWLSGADRLLFLGSSCIYPKLAPQPIRETALLSGPLEPTNRAYALAKIAGVEMCWSYNRQYGTKFLTVMPTNLYGRGDNYDLRTSHVVPALLRKFHEAKAAGAGSVSVWGSGQPRRELLYADDMADACVHLLAQSDEVFGRLLGSDEAKSGVFDPPLVNIGTGQDISIRSLAEHIGQTVGFAGQVEFDGSKPDGTPQKLLDVSKLTGLGWAAKTDLREGLRLAYLDFLSVARA